MSAITNAANTAFRDFNTDGVPASGPYDPAKADIRALFTLIGVNPIFTGTVAASVLATDGMSNTIGTVNLGSGNPTSTGGVELRNILGIRQSIFGIQVLTGGVGGAVNYHNDAGNGHFMDGGDIIHGGTARPNTDNAISLGTSSRRYSVVYAATGTINTSDEREKNWRGTLTTEELVAAKEISAAIGIYQWKDAVTEKGADGARWHCGVKAQQVVSIMTAHGLDAMRYGFVCYDKWDAQAAGEGIPETTDPETGLVSPAFPGTAAIPAGDRYGIRPDELAYFVFAAQEQRIAALEAASH